MNARRTFLKLLGLAPVIAALPKVEEDLVLRYNDTFPRPAITGLSKGPTHYFACDPPPQINASEGDLWFALGNASYTMYRFNGKTWEPAEDVA